MPPRLPLRPIRSRNAFTASPTVTENGPVCLFCSLSCQADQRPVRRRIRTKTVKPLGGSLGGRRFESTATSSTTRAPTDPRKELEEALVSLQKHAPNYVNLSRIQLALNGLRQRRGDESIRVAILGVNSDDGSGPRNTAKEVLKLLLADPLKPEEDWEREIDSHDLSQPLIVRIGAEKPREAPFTRGSLLHEVHVSSAVLNGHNVELLLMDTNPPQNRQQGGTLESFEDSVLVPTVDIPTSNTGRYTPITTPVHKALFVANSFRGAASLATTPALYASSVVSAAVNLPSYKPEETEASKLPFTVIDVDTAGAGLKTVRKDLRAAIEFEHLWFHSNVPKLVEWLKSDTLNTAGEITKPPVKALIASVLAKANIAINQESAQKHGQASSISASSLHKLRTNLATWAESAHGELQEQLDIAFSSKRWRRLRWWKLFWRVDDVGMLTTDILNQRFLTAAERNSIFLAGRVHEATDLPDSIPATKSEQTSSQSVAQSTETNTPHSRPAGTSLWPANIASARNHLQTETVPALQALAQKLVLQTLTTSGLTSSLGALVYVGTLTTTAYEAGAVAALGIVWSMKRMQKRWETVRRFWEGEVREEGRKAVRDVEREFTQSLADTEAAAGSKGDPEATGKPRELAHAKELLDRAWKAYEELK